MTAADREIEHFATRIAVVDDSWIALYHGDVAYEHEEAAAAPMARQQVEFVTGMRIRELILFGLITITAVLANLDVPSGLLTWINLLIAYGAGDWRHYDGLADQIPFTLGLGLLATGAAWALMRRNEARLQDYGTAGIPNAQGLGARADLYERFVLEEVMPWATSRYRLRGGPAHTAVLGSSLGGLAAFDLAWRHPDLFGTVGAMSGSFWWRTADGTLEAKQGSRVALRMVREATPLPRLRIWLETADGDETSDRDGNGVIDSIQDTDDLVQALAARGYAPGQDVVHLTVPGGHDQATWGRVLPQFLVFAFR